MIDAVLLRLFRDLQNRSFRGFAPNFMEHASLYFPNTFCTRFDAGAILCNTYAEYDDNKDGVICLCEDSDEEDVLVEDGILDHLEQTYGMLMSLLGTEWLRCSYLAASPNISSWRTTPSKLACPRWAPRRNGLNHTRSSTLTPSHSTKRLGLRSGNGASSCRVKFTRSYIWKRRGSWRG